jgi:hypothetical protein
VTQLRVYYKRLRKTVVNSWLEQRNHNPRVRGSSPSSATISFSSKTAGFLGDTPCLNMSVESHENARFVNLCVTGV